MFSIIAQYIANCKIKSLGLHNILYFTGWFCHKGKKYTAGRTAAADKKRTSLPYTMSSSLAGLFQINGSVLTAVKKILLHFSAFAFNTKVHQIFHYVNHL